VEEDYEKWEKQFASLHPEVNRPKRKVQKKVPAPSVDWEDRQNIGAVNPSHPIDLIDPEDSGLAAIDLSDDEDLELRRLERTFSPSRLPFRRRPLVVDIDDNPPIARARPVLRQRQPRPYYEDIDIDDVFPPVPPSQTPQPTWGGVPFSFLGGFDPVSYLSRIIRFGGRQDDGDMLQMYDEFAPEFDPYDQEYHPRHGRRHHHHRSRGHHAADRNNPLFQLQFRDIRPEDYDALLTLDERVARKSKAASKSEIQALKKEKIADPAELGDSNSKCSICLEDFKAGAKVVHLPCNHVFDADCVAQWLQVSRTCPICKLDIRQGDS
jgi:hypothetical protein